MEDGGWRMDVLNCRYDSCQCCTLLRTFCCGSGSGSGYGCYGGVGAGGAQARAREAVVVPTLVRPEQSTPRGVGRAP